jgi:hypothetical protein
MSSPVDIMMPNLAAVRSVSGLSWAQNESSDRTRSKGAATLARYPEHTGPGARSRGRPRRHFFFELNLNSKARLLTSKVVAAQWPQWHWQCLERPELPVPVPVTSECGSSAPAVAHWHWQAAAAASSCPPGLGRSFIRSNCRLSNRPITARTCTLIGSWLMKTVMWLVVQTSQRGRPLVTTFVLLP